MGAGIYVVWPAFYTDVTDAYRLDRAGRLRTDLGGVYVNAIIVLVTAGGYAVTGYDPLVLLCFLLQVPPGQPVGEQPVELNAIQLPTGVLVQGADPDVTHALTADDPRSRPVDVSG